MGKGSSGHKANEAGKKKCKRYLTEKRLEKNKARKARKEVKKNKKLLLKGKGILAKK
jgi:hypothetical protein